MMIDSPRGTLKRIRLPRKQALIPVSVLKTLRPSCILDHAANKQLAFMREGEIYLDEQAWHMNTKTGESPRERPLKEKLFVSSTRAPSITVK